MLETIILSLSRSLESSGFGMSRIIIVSPEEQLVGSAAKERYQFHGLNHMI